MKRFFFGGVIVVFVLGIVGGAQSRVRKIPENRVMGRAGDKLVTVGEKEQPAPANTIEFNIEAKRKEVMDLVKKGIDFFNKTKSLAVVLNAFSNGDDYWHGELYLFVYDMQGVCLADGFYQDRIWQNFYDERDSYGTPYIQHMIETAQKGGGWVTHTWYNAIKVSWIQKISKDGVDYLIGCGYYPFSKEDAVVGLVKAASSLFKKTMEEGKPANEAFGLFGYPLGRFVLGDLYLYAMTVNGDLVAHGERSGLIGTNGWDYKDSRGKYVNREIVEKLKKSTDGVWVDYFSKRAPKRAYAQKVVDNKGTEYFIACGYYPDANRNAAIDLVRKGYVYVKSHGLTAAAHEFNSIDHLDFRYGDLYLYVFDLKGQCLAEGSNSEMVGKNLWDERDGDGRYYVRELVQKAQDGGGWVNIKEKNSIKSNYVELVDLGVGKYVIGCGLFAGSKLETMTLLAKSAVGLFSTSASMKDALAEFIKPHGRFVLGDLEIFVIRPDGICLAYGTEHDLIWGNLLSRKDSSGMPIVKMFADSITRGPGLVTYNYKGDKYVAYVEGIEKEGSTYIIGSSFTI
jgi:signal transduction histidine kinase